MSPKVYLSSDLVSNPQLKMLSYLVPNPELSVIFHSQDWLYHGDDEELEYEAFLEQGLELWEGVWDAEVRVGAVEGV